jgi:hypothetical protein
VRRRRGWICDAREVHFRRTAHGDSRFEHVRSEANRPSAEWLGNAPLRRVVLLHEVQSNFRLDVDQPNCLKR